MDSLKNTLGKFFGVAFRAQTYLNALYLLLAFPLGLTYFIVLVVGLAVGFPLMIIWVGLLILLAVFGIWYALIALERQMAISLLRVEIAPMANQDLTGKSLWQKFTAMLSNPVTWKGLVYLFAKFPLGTLSFVVLVTLVAISGALIAAPLYFPYFPAQVDLTLWGAPWDNTWMIDTLPEALLACLAGLLIGLASMHILNGLAWVSGQFARIMLGNSTPVPAAPPSTPVVPTEPETPSLPA